MLGRRGLHGRSERFIADVVSQICLLQIERELLLRILTGNLGLHFLSTADLSLRALTAPRLLFYNG